VPLVLEREALASSVPATRRVVVFVHGSCMTCHQWRRREHDHGEALERDTGVTALHVVYNSGLHISTNGRGLAALLEELFAAWPAPLDEISLVGHSMGGLVARSAAHYAAQDGLAFRQRLRRLSCLGSPHHGALLERTGNWLGVLLGVSRYSAPFERLPRIRSAGVTDLRYGNVLDDDWAVHDRFAPRGDGRTHLPLPTDVDCFLVAGSLTAAPGTGEPRGDGLVTVASALGQHDEPGRTLSLADARKLVVYGHGHLDLLDSREVYTALRSFFSP